MGNAVNVVVRELSPLHTEQDLNSAWRVWADRRQQIVEYVQKGYSYLDPDVVRSIVLCTELAATCTDANFERFIRRQDVTGEVTK